MDKYKIGETFKDLEFTDLNYLILYLSPRPDSDNEYSYFVEITSEDDNSIWYGAYEESFFNNKHRRKIK